MGMDIYGDLPKEVKAICCSIDDLTDAVKESLSKDFILQQQALTERLVHQLDRIACALEGLVERE